MSEQKIKNMSYDKLKGEIIEVMWSHPTLGKGVIDVTPNKDNTFPYGNIVFVCGKPKFNFKNLLPVWWR